MKVKSPQKTRAPDVLRIRSISAPKSVTALPFVLQHGCCHESGVVRPSLLALLCKGICGITKLQPSIAGTSKGG